MSRLSKDHAQTLQTTHRNVGLNIALEIDGKQHEYADRKESDKKKDKYLIDNGWKVSRIKWK